MKGTGSPFSLSSSFGRCFHSWRFGLTEASREEVTSDEWVCSALESVAPTSSSSATWWADPLEHLLLDRSDPLPGAGLVGSGGGTSAVQVGSPDLRDSCVCGEIVVSKLGVHVARQRRHGARHRARENFVDVVVDNRAHVRGERREGRRQLVMVDEMHRQLARWSR